MKPAPPKTPDLATSDRPGPGAIVLVGICVVAAAVMMAVRGPEPRSEGPRQSGMATSRSAAVSDRADLRAGTLKAEAVAHPEASHAGGSAMSIGTVSAIEPDAVAGEPPAEATVAPVAADSESVTITGCLERNDDTFKLTQTAGADAPRSRSWKSGFLTRRPASIELVSADEGVRLSGHVGRRVAATGLLTDREMQVLSMQRVATSCDSPRRSG